MRWMRNAQHSGADHHPAVEKAHALQAMLGATRLSLQTRHLVRLRRSNVTTFIALFVGVIVGLGFLVTNSSPKTAAPDRAGLFVAQFSRPPPAFHRTPP